MSLRKKSRETIVAVFAHPDDEAFGPAGTIAKLARENDVYLICATRGEAGKGDAKKLGKTRSGELLVSAKILGVKKVFVLGFADGTLSNSLYHDLVKKIGKTLEELKADVILTYEPRGISGHIDHIVVSMVCSYIFERTKFIKKILYYCLDQKSRDKFSYDYFIYFPPGYKKSEMDMEVDVSDVWDLKMVAMMAHKSQKHDADRIIQRRKGMPKKEYFLVSSK